MTNSGADDEGPTQELRGAFPDAEAPHFQALYAELRQVAGRVFRSQRAGHTLSPTVLVHEAWLKMQRAGAAPPWRDRTHFLNVASRAMRQVLMNHARDRAALKRGGPARRRVTLEDIGQADGAVVDLLDLHEALARLEALDARQGEIARMRLLGGLAIAEIAALLGVSQRTVELDWRMAKEVLAARLGPRPGTGA